MKKDFILALVGSSGVGKTTLMIELLKRMPEVLYPIPTLATRDRRGPEDDIFCRFMSREEVLKMKENGQLVQFHDYNGNLYGTDRADLEKAYAHGIGMRDYTENSVLNLRAAGVKVIPIKIVSADNDFRNEERARLDKEREKIQLDYALTVENSFKEGGKEKCLEQLEKYIRSL